MTSYRVEVKAQVKDFKDHLYFPNQCICCGRNATGNHFYKIACRIPTNYPREYLEHSWDFPICATCNGHYLLGDSKRTFITMSKILVGLCIFGGIILTLIGIIMFLTSKDLDSHYLSIIFMVMGPISVLTGYPMYRKRLSQQKALFTETCSNEVPVKYIGFGKQVQPESEGQIFIAGSDGLRIEKREFNNGFIHIHVFEFMKKDYAELFSQYNGGRLT